MSVKKLKKTTKIKKAVSQRASKKIKKKAVGKKTAKKAKFKTLKKPRAKKALSGKATKKLLKRNTDKKRQSHKTDQKSGSNKSLKNLKTPSKQLKDDKNQKAFKQKKQALEQRAFSRKQTAKKKIRGAVSSLAYCEKELEKLLEKEKEEKLVLKDMKGRTYCVVENCDYPAVVEGYCRIHFFSLFKVIKKRKQIVDQDILTKSYISLSHKHSEAVFEYLLKDLSSDKDFKLALRKFTDEEVSDLSDEESFFD